jgi:hypothetical protein
VGKRGGWREEKKQLQNERKTFEKELNNRAQEKAKEKEPVKVVIESPPLPLPPQVWITKPHRIT